jgi:hypothetical protein
MYKELESVGANEIELRDATLARIWWLTCVTTQSGREEWYAVGDVSCC